jgi:hypothetical protein
MRTPKEIYGAYNIMQNLQLHQLRVAAVGKLICDNFKEPVNTRDVILACLFHDMGNILKFDLTFFPEFLEPQGLAYWESVKADYEKRYGKDQHAATKKIAQELGLQQSVIDCIDATGFSKMRELVETTSFEKKICEYADSRVTPYGVRSLDERFRDGRKRYLGRVLPSPVGVTAAPDEFEILIGFGHQLEAQIFACTSIRPEDINDAAVALLIGELSEYAVA